MKPSKPHIKSLRVILKVVQCTPPHLQPISVHLVARTLGASKGCLQITMTDLKPAESEHVDAFKSPSKAWGDMLGGCLRGGLGVVPLHSTSAEHLRRNLPKCVCTQCAHLCSTSTGPHKLRIIFTIYYDVCACARDALMSTAQGGCKRGE